MPAKCERASFLNLFILHTRTKHHTTLHREGNTNNCLRFNKGNVLALGTDSGVKIIVKLLFFRNLVCVVLRT